ncbi:phage terminase large subunit, partial [Megasphaera sp. BL7]|uniref:phage terminase large subunit n=1 Tax=Megasphaera sp. BL7 TaxID=1285585 RepID=UPI00056A6986
ITYKKTGQKILFFGVDDPQKIKSIKLPFGYVGICWIEELDQFSGMEEIRNLNQSLLRGGPVFWEFCSFNPPKSQNNWVNEEKLFDDPDRLVHHSTYLGVPREWLGDRFFEDAEKLKERNETAYRHEYLGEVTGTGGVVFENVEDMAMSNELVVL